ncbi:uncharacterized protein arhgef5 [Brachyhypopomus gauderio]|uniref:uncharacterized protein arhgef5 n=1 Tax=Brachyhypopomus gauderio TaxID=698409 RepID=UPI0040421D70
METKRTNWTTEEPLHRSPSPATRDRGYQSSEWISREARPQAGPSSRAEREREREGQRAREMDRIWKRPREGRREVDAEQRDRERFGAFKGRAGDTELKDRDRRREDSRDKNGRFASVQNLMIGEVRERERGTGDTFPRTRRRSNEREEGKNYYNYQGHERGGERGTGRPRETDVSGRDREREREAKRREVQRHRELREEMKRDREEMRRGGGRRGEAAESDRTRQRGWEHDKRERWRERHTEVNDRLNTRGRGGDGERVRPGPTDREDCLPSPQSRRLMEGNRENYSDREEMDERIRAGRKDRYRQKKSEGDVEKERDVPSGEDSGAPCETVRPRERVREGERYREIERTRERDMTKGRETDTLGSGGRERNREWMMEGFVERSREREMKKRDGVREERGSDGQRDEVSQHRKRKQDLGDRQWREERETSQAHSYGAERGMGVYLEWRETGRRRSLEDERKGRSSQRLTDVYRKMKTVVHSAECLSGSNAVDEQRRRGVKDEKRASTSECAEEKRKKRSEERQGVTKEEWGGEARGRPEKEEVESEKEREGEKTERNRRPLKKMWLPPRSERERTESQEEEFRERERLRERYAERYRQELRDKGETAEDRKHETEKPLPEDSSGNLDIAGEFRNDDDREIIEERSISDEDTEPVFDTGQGLDAPWQTEEAENMSNDLEGSDGGSERESDRSVDSEGKEGDEEEWEGEGKERVISGEDEFVTVSSGGDEDEVEFEDCEEFWDGEIREDLTREPLTRIHQREGEIETGMTKERSDHAVTVFCVVGQPLPRSGSNQSPPMDHMEEEEANQHSAVDSGDNSEVDQDVEPSRDIFTTEESVREGCGTSEETTQAESVSTGHSLPLPEGTSSSHDSGKAEDHEITKEISSAEHQQVTDINDTCSQNREEGGDVERSFQSEETQRPPEDRKRHSAAPHVKWAKNILHEILGSSDDGDLNVTELNTQSERPNGTRAEVERQGDAVSSASPLYGVVLKPRKHGNERKCVDPEQIQARTEERDVGGDGVALAHTKVDMPAGKEIIILVERESEEDEEAEKLRIEKEFLEGETDEEAEGDLVLPSPDAYSLSSEGETEKEESRKKPEKKKKKGVWDLLSSSSFRDLGNDARFRRIGFRKTEKQDEGEEGGGGGRDRRTLVLPSDSEYDELRFTWSEADMKKGMLNRTRMRKSKYYNSQLYQQYSEVVQNREILHQAHSDTSSTFGEAPPTLESSTSCPSPKLARRPLPPIPPVPHPHTLTHSSSLSGALTPSQSPSSPRFSRSFTSSPMLWQDLPGVRSNPELKTLSADERRLQEVRFEVVTSEASYCSSLDIVVEHFVKSKQLNTLLTTQDKNWLFSRLGDVRAISHSFFTQLEQRVESDLMHFTVCDIIIKHCPRFRSVYVPYLTNQSYQDKTYQKLMNENPAFRHMVEKLEHSPKCQRLPFRSFLILPFQRITRLKLLVQNIAKRTAPKTKGEAQAIKAMKLLEKMIQESNDSISQMKSIESLVSLNARVDFECKTLPLISQSRRLVREGPVTELRDLPPKETERSAYMHLFNDYVLLSLPKEGNRFTVIEHGRVSELRVENFKMKLHSSQKNVFRLYIGNKALLLGTDTLSDKLRWISALSRPHPEIDFTAAQDFLQMQCMRAFVAQQPDELSLEKADVLLVHKQSSDGWVEGTRLSDRQRGWVPLSHLDLITSETARQCNLADTLKITTATATV